MPQKDILAVELVETVISAQRINKEESYCLEVELVVGKAQSHRSFVHGALYLA